MFPGLRARFKHHNTSIHNAMFWFILICSPLVILAKPRFDPTALLREVLIPADAAVGSIIYRLRASDPTFDYPLVFTLYEKSTAVSVDSLNCTRFNSVCQANVVLRKKLEAGRFYDFTVYVRSVRGDSATLNCSFRATNATTPIGEIFPGAPTLLMVSEDSRRNTEIGTFHVRGNPHRPKAVLLELWGAPQFGLHQHLVTDRDAEGTVLLLSPLDYESATVHHLTILANDPWTDLETDTRNIASWPLLVAVLDEQDTPPIFSLAPPTTTLSPSLRPGDLILRVHAEDGDRGNPRDVRYGLVSEGNPFISFFNISEETGELRLARPLNEILSISHTGQPILLTVIAEEVRANPQEPPAQSSTVRLALIPPGVTAGSPIFGANEYNALLDENSPTGTVLDLPQAEIITQPGDVVTLSFINDNGTFDISPSVVEGHSAFTVSVHDPKLLDYERWHSVHCFIVAKEIGNGNFTAKTKLNVLLNDLNDNYPKFTQAEYHGIIAEGAKIGTTVLRVEASDTDREPGSLIKYTRLIGSGSQFFSINSETGLVTVANSQALNAEKMPIITFSVEAADENGKGKTATSTIIINLIDINDEVPQFDKNVYEFILNSDKTSFTTPAFIKATDADISSPNNDIHYELINAVDNLFLNEKTGELTLTKTWPFSEVVVVKSRVWDEGIPRLSSECEIRIYPPEGQSRKMIFIVPGSHPDTDSVMSTLRALTGGRVAINEIRPYTGYIPGATDVSRDSDTERSVVIATVTYSKDGVIDVNHVQQILDREHNQVIYNEEKEVERAGSWWWLVVLLLFLLLLAALILILCCICEGCPLYVPPKRRNQVSTDVEQLVIKGSGQGRESKSVQVAEWFGRREAWTPDHGQDIEAESLRRHEMDRGSERDVKRIQRQQNVQAEPPRDQYYIRDGNADILRLITRGGEQQQQQLQQRPVTLIPDQVYLADSGKDILMRRFIDQQQAEVAKQQILLPNAVNRFQTEHEQLEASLREQNALLRQILLERERDLRLETQSLPAGTQTDQDAFTQTESKYLRRVHSDNDASDNSDDDLAVIKARTRRRHSRKDKSHIRRKIKTPIQEESEMDSSERLHKDSRSSSSKPEIKQTRTSELRQKQATSEARSSRSGSIHKEVLKEISASLDHSNNEVLSEDSLEDENQNLDKSINSTRQKYHSESDLRLISTKSDDKSVKSQSHSDLTKETPKKTKTKPKKGTARYMEWYEKKKKPKETDKKQEKGDIKQDEVIKETVKMVSSRLMQDTESSFRKKVTKKVGSGPEHPLLQHSEYRYEAQYPLKKKPEEDADSGIALTRPPMAQKKSVFTIVYDDMHTNQLRPDSTTPP